MSLGEGKIADLHSVLWIKLTFSDGLGGGCPKTC